MKLSISMILSAGMNKIMLRLVMASILLLINISTLSAQAGESGPQPDIRHTVDSLYNIIPTLEGEDKINAYTQLYYAADYTIPYEERLGYIKEFIHEAHRQGDTHLGVLLRSAELLYHYNEGREDRFMEVYPEHTHFMEKHGDMEQLLSAWGLKMQIYTLGEQYDKMLAEAEAMREKVATKNNPYLSGLVLSRMGVAHLLQGKDDYACTLLMESIDLMEKNLPTQTGDIEEVYIFLINTLLGIKRYDDVLHYNARYEQFVLKDEAQQAEEDIPTDKFWLTTSRFYCNIHYAHAWLGKNEPGRAEVYISKCRPHLDKVPDTMKCDYHIANSLLADSRGEFAEAAASIQQAIDILKADSKQYSEVGRPDWHKLKAGYLAKAGQLEESVQAYDSAYILLELIQNEDFENRIEDIRTRYEVDRLEAEKLRNRNYFIFALLGCALLAVILALSIKYQRHLRAKNKTLVQQIEDREAISNQLRQLRQARLVDPTSPAQGGTWHDDTPTPGESRETALFAQLENYLRTTNAYTNPELDRQEIITALGTNQTYLYNAVKTVMGISLQEYINTLRLEKAKNILKNHPDAPIAQIAIQCGFATLRTFNRKFKEYYGLTPSEYKAVVKG